MVAASGAVAGSALDAQLSLPFIIVPFLFDGSLHPARLSSRNARPRHCFRCAPDHEFAHDQDHSDTRCRHQTDRCRDHCAGPTALCSAHSVFARSLLIDPNLRLFLTGCNGPLVAEILISGSTRECASISQLPPAVQQYRQGIRLVDAREIANSELHAMGILPCMV